MKVTSSSVPRGLTVLALLLGWLVLYFGVRFYLETNPGMARTARIAIAFIPAPVFAAFLVQYIRRLRGADELERRVQMEALAVAFPLGLVLLMTLALVQRAVELSFQDWSFNHVWPYFVLFYLIGLVISRRRYS
jgi:hypothetical protein